MQNYYLRGPVLSNDVVYIATIYSTTINNVTYNDLYFLVKQGQSYIFTAQLITPIAFILDSPDNDNTEVSLAEANNLGTFIGPIQQPISGTTQTVAGPIQQYNAWTVQPTTSINPWGIFLTGVIYTIADLSWIVSPVTSRNKANACFPVGTINNLTTVTQQFYVVPQKWYVLNQSCGQLEYPIAARNNELYWFYNQQCGVTATQRLITPVIALTEDDAGSPFLRQGFTRLSDCDVGVFYPYCTGTTQCGGSIAGAGCMGPCPESDLGCRVDQTNKDYTCTPPSPPQPLGLPLWAWVLIIIGLIGLFLAIVVGGFFLIIYLGKKKPS